MRTDFAWPAVWAACFIGGVLFGSTGQGRALLSPRQGLRGDVPPVQADAAAGADTLVEKGVVAEDAAREAGDYGSGITGGTTRAESTVSSPSGDQRGLITNNGIKFVQDLPVVERARMTDLTQGLWGPDEDEAAQLADEFEDFVEMGDVISKLDAFDFFAGTDYSLSYDFDDDDEDGSYDYDYDSDLE